MKVKELQQTEMKLTTKDVMSLAGKAGIAFGPGNIPFISNANYVNIFTMERFSKLVIEKEKSLNVV